ncbi:MAG: hypothetical protein UIM53_05980 [Acutalibacteraceae bacterium]|nr:hypothetical protein [Acutalibacteraceae bacterium]
MRRSGRRYFIDIDGTLAVYISKNYPWWEIDGIFRVLKPQEQVLQAVRDLIHNQEEVYILTAYHRETPQVKDDKIFWLRKHLPEVSLDHQIYTFCGEDKTLYISEGVKPTDILLDDFNKNLEKWREAGGIGIKLLNGLNSKHSWGGLSIQAQEASKNIFDTLVNIHTAEISF